MDQSDTLYQQVCRLSRRENVTSTPKQTSVPRLHLVYCEQPTALAHVVYDPVFCYVLGGEKLAYSSGRQLPFAAGYGVVVSMDVPAVSQITKASLRAPYAAVAVHLDVALLRRISGESPSFPVEDARGAFETAPISHRLHDVMARLVGLVDQADLRAGLAPLYLQELHLLLLRSAQGQRLRAIARADTKSAKIAETTAYLRHHMAKPMRVEALAQRAGMSVSAFHHRFREATGATPVQFLKRLRLLEAQRMLLAGNASVTQASFAVGYESPSQFSRDFRRMFDVAPSRAHVLAADA
ncbi:HTH-type transcriptional activator RhaS [Aquimixticola soesokkakensis]|uniref:HTH-type transcriptional activator RhaS n=1 Tax=Aquimixticola soesokkakensis TaxID=1519096 RepID=A0A1Y5RDS4_9RHOB|nr:AraC family transcriptional regulator [Aquimixticola soesokkakensis]SLN15145.1 HTH-type transcriptional activator RhaS [Aquimixticola soesokkakensis]